MTRRLVSLVLLLIVAVLMTACATDEQAAADLPAIPESSLLRYLEPKSGRIAYLAADANVYTINQGGLDPIQITHDALVPPDATRTMRVYDIPYWSPDGSYLAFAGTEATLAAEITRSAVYLARADGSQLTELYHNEYEQVRHLVWAPDGQHVVAVMGLINTDIINVYLLSLDPATSPTLISTANRFFFDMHEEASDMLIHSFAITTHGLISRASLEDSAVREMINYGFTPAAFASPAWSPNGEEALFAAQGAEGLELVSVARSGDFYRSLVALEGPVAFAWSPDGEEVAYIEAPGSVGYGIVGPLRVIDVLRPQPAEVTVDGPVVAFFWSPDGRRIAYFTAAQPPAGTAPAGTQWLVLSLLDVQSGATVQRLVFEPTPVFLGMIALFDQYSRSLSIWSPDSENLVISGQPVTGIEEQAPGGIWVIATDTGLYPRFIGPGAIAAWSWE